jgi:Secretion system C-terminal sorting domain
MKHKILLTACLLAISIIINAQKKQSLVYAITAPANNAQSGWTEARMIDLASGSIKQSFIETTSLPNVYNARTGKIVGKVAATNSAIQSAFATYSAACAYDKKHNRLYYTPMGINQLRYIDCNAKTPSAYYFEGEAFGVVKNLADAANHITRMVIDGNGNGYALSNDGNHFIKFTTAKKPVITDLGAMNDDAANGTISIRNQCSGWGGDIVADAEGNLYLIAASAALYKITVATKQAKYLGHIQNLPKGFTTNGAAVTDDGKLIVSSANYTQGYYQINMENLQATIYSEAATTVNTSDLASGNLLFNPPAKDISIPLLQPKNNAKSLISVYPNPVSDGMVQVSFDKLAAGRYSIDMVDQSGKILLQKQVFIGFKGQVAGIDVNEVAGKGVYIIKVQDQLKKQVTTAKIIVL